MTQAAQQARPIKFTMLFHKTKAAGNPGRCSVHKLPVALVKDQRLYPFQPRD
jgi:hypothetical protein